VNEIVRTMAFDVSMILQEGGVDEKTAPRAVKMMKELALTMQRLEAAASMNVKRETEIRDQARREAADTAEMVAKQGGLKAESVQELRRAILGMRE
jgi:HD-GYP domain-containing protein (c-di-GMP phosphodiesterase class II)